MRHAASQAAAAIRATMRGLKRLYAALDRAAERAERASGEGCPF